MADGERSALGLSVGATNLAAVTADRAVTRKPVLTLYPQRRPEVGVPAENPRLTEPGLVITDFVDRVGDPAGIVAADGTTHRGETLVADALRALAYTATDGRALPEAVAVTHPAHWGQAAVGALQGALIRVSEWSGGRLWLLPDSAAAVTALQANPGLPSRGIIAVCDFGGSGTSLTLVDAANGYQPVAPTLRHADFSGDLVDQTLLTHVVADLSSAGSFDTSATSAIGPLTRLRAACRHAKEELSSTSATTLTADVPGYRGDIRVTRTELDDAIRQPLGGFVASIQETLQRNGICAADLVAVASVGGGASIPAVTTTLSDQLRVPVITSPRPHLTAAIGAALSATRGPADTTQTALAQPATALGPALDATMVAEAPPEPSPPPALAWSEAGDDSGIMPLRTGEYPVARDAAAASARPQTTVGRDVRGGGTAAAVEPWYRRPPVVIIGTALVVLALGAAVLITLRHTSGSAPSTPGPGVSSTPASSAPDSQSSAPSSATDTQGNTPSPSSSESDTGTPPSTTTQAPSTTTQVPTTTQPTTTAQSPAPPRDPGGRGIPGMPRFVPQPEPGLGGR
jgi:hypothetical protein